MCNITSNTNLINLELFERKLLPRPNWLHLYLMFPQSIKVQYFLFQNTFNINMFKGLVVALLSISFVGSAKVKIQPRSCGRFHYLYLDSVFLILFKYIIVWILKGSPWWKGDNFCDDENNNAACQFDGGDCCNNFNFAWDIYCNVS